MIMMLVIGFAMGSLSGFVMMRIRSNDRRGWWKDGLLGMASYVSVFALLIYITAVHRIESWLANPALGAFLAAILIPAIREWLRSSQPRT
jgi:hypothetical protein